MALATKDVRTTPAEPATADRLVSPWLRPEFRSALMLAVERLGDISLVLLQALERSIRSAVRDVKLQRYVQGPARRPEVEDRVKRFWQEADGAMVGDNVMAAEDFAAEMRRRLGLG